jgi:hypothetical protein
MPRTVDHIVACHQAAAALRAAGKPVWDKTIDIKSILHEDQGNGSAEHIAHISVRIAALLRARLPESFFEFGHENHDETLVDAIEAMEECTAASLEKDVAEGFDPTESFNGWLESIYDWADANRIWLG